MTVPTINNNDANNNVIFLFIKSFLGFIPMYLCTFALYGRHLILHDNNIA
nr:MAG TPA: hypothetical protein [Caudoviricetes sp.]